MKLVPRTRHNLKLDVGEPSAVGEQWANAINDRLRRARETQFSHILGISLPDCTASF